MMLKKFDNIIYSLMRKFNTLDLETIDKLPIPVVMGILDKMNIEAREEARQVRLAEKKTKMMRRR